MATIKSYVDIEQSKKLAEILPLESADFCYIKTGVTSDNWMGVPEYQFKPIPHKDYSGESIGCWSLAALIDVLPEIIHIKDWENYIICIDKDSICYKRKEDALSQTILHESRGTNLVDACYEMIIRLHSNQLL